MPARKKQSPKRSPSSGLFRVGELATRPDPIIHPTGWWDLDYGILQLGGFVSGGISQLAGEPQSGKTFICAKIVANAQKRGYRCAWMDVESYLTTYGIERIAQQGVDIDSLILIESDEDNFSAEKRLQAVIDLAWSSKENPVDGVWADIIVVDSVAALVPALELDKTLDESSMKARRAGVLADFVDRACRAAFRTNSLILLTNQVRCNIGAQYWEKKTTTPGGFPLKHRLLQVLELEKGKRIVDEDTGEIIGNEARACLTASKVTGSFRVTGKDTPSHLRIYYDGRDEDKTESLVSAAIHAEVITRSGGWYYFGERKAQGRNGIVELVRSQKLEEELEAALRQSLPRWDEELSA